MRLAYPAITCIEDSGPDEGIDGEPNQVNAEEIEVCLLKRGKHRLENGRAEHYFPGYNIKECGIV